MTNLKFIKDLDKNDAKKLVDSFDNVFFDIDGVLTTGGGTIPGAIETVVKLRQLGKMVSFVTNNSLHTKDMLIKKLQPFEVQDNEVFTPNDSLLAYLKKIDFKKDIYVISCSYPKKLLMEAGYNIIEYKDIQTEDLVETLGTIDDLGVKSIEIGKNVDAVYVDIDYNFHYGSIQVAEEILNNFKDVLFLSSMDDDLVKINRTNGLGPKFYIDALERWTKRKSLKMGKPGDALKELLNSNFQIVDCNRVLFVGDNVHTDISFGSNCGYQTLLMLSGVTSENQIDPWEFNENCKPTYVAGDIGDLYNKIKEF